jgi:hypothetical protein
MSNASAKAVAGHPQASDTGFVEAETSFLFIREGALS